MFRQLATALLAGLTIVLSANAAELSGTATYRERITLPPHAVFEAVIVDVARRDAPAVALAAVRIDAPGQPPISFSISYDPARLDTRAVYALRAGIRVDGQLWFTSDEIVRVLDPSATASVPELMLRRVSGNEADQSSPQQSRRLIAGAVTRQQGRLVLEICAEGIHTPIAPGSNDTGIAGVLGATDGPIFVAVLGNILPAQGMMPTQTLVERTLAVFPGENCDRNRSNAVLADTYWRVISLKDVAIKTGRDERESSLIFKSGEQPRVGATVGCNRLSGGYVVEKEKLALSKLATTLMACPPHLAERERALIEVLEATRSYAISGPVMALFGEEGMTLAVLQAVHLQ